MRPAGIDSRATPEGVRREDWVFLVLACLAAFGIRLLYSRVSRPVASPDSTIYYTSGLELLQGELISSDIVMPGYPLLIAAAGWDGILPLQAALSAASVALVFFLSLAILGRVAWARWAAALMALSPLSIFYANQRMTETVYIALLCLALLALYRARFFWGSVLLVVMLLVRPTLDLLNPVLVVAFCFVHERRPPWRTVARRLGVYAAVYLALMAPWWLHNHDKYGQFVRLNLGDGIVMRMEHNELFWKHGFWDHLGPIFKEFEEVTDPIERNRLRREAAWRFVAEDPLRYAGLALRRLGRFWSPIVDQSEGHFYRARWPALPLECFILAGAALFLWRWRRSWRRILPLLLIIGYFTAVHVALNALVRYRVPLVPLLVVLAGAAWQPLAAAALLRVRERARRRRAASS